MEKTMGNILEIPSFSFQWSITDCILLWFCEKSGTRYLSPDFQCGDTTWYLSIYPNGLDPEDSGWLSLYLIKRKSTHPKDVVTYTLGVKHRDGVDYTRREVVTGEFGENGIGRGCHRFLKSLELLREKDKLLPNDVLTVYCTLSFQRNVRTASQQMAEEKNIAECSKEKQKSKEESCKEVERNDTLNGIKEMTEDFKELLLNESDCDVTLKVKGRDFRAHMLILGVRSPVFRSMFKNDTVERISGIVDILDCDPDAFQDFLLYLYSGKVEKLNTCNALNLYSVVDKYGGDDLKLKCLHFIEENLSVDTFGDVIALALQCNQPSLLKTATDFFTKNIRDILVTDKWQSFVIKNPIACNELHIKALNSIVQK